MLEFICGVKGSGKSSLTVRRIIRDLSSGKKVMLIVPEQMAAAAEGEVVRAAEGVPFVDLEVTNFRRLSDSVFRKYGGLSYKYIDKGARLLVMRQAVCAALPFLEEYCGSAGRELELASVMLSAYDELRKNGIGEDELEKILSDPDISGSELGAKLRDISRVCGEYDAALGGTGYTDKADDLLRLAEVLSSHRAFSGMSVYLDSFNGFTEEEMRVIRFILRDADSVTVSLLCDPEGKRKIFDGVRRTRAAITRIANELGVALSPDTVLDSSLSAGNDCLRALESSLFEDSKVPYRGNSSHIRVVECNGRYAEAEMIACDISEKIRRGARYKDFAVVAGDGSDYEGIIDTELERFGIPCFISKRAELKVRPLVKYLLSALRIVEYDFRASDVISYIKTGFCDAEPDECDITDAYIRLWNVNGVRMYDCAEWNMNPDGYKKKISSRGAGVLKTVNTAIKKIAPPLISLYEKISRGGTAAEISRALYEFMLSSGADEKCRGDAEAETAWNCITESFDSLVNTAGDEKMSLALYCDLLYALIEQKDIGRLPRTKDEVIIGSASGLRLNGISTVYLVGVNEDVFPRRATEMGIFSDSEKKKIEALGYVLSKSIEAADEESELAFYDAACSARDGVVFSFVSGAVRGEEQKMARVLSSLINKFGIRIEKYSERPVEDHIWEYEPSFDYALKYADTPTGKALCRVYSQDPVYGDRLKKMRISVSTGAESVDSGTAASVFPDELLMSPSKLEKYVLCRFEYYCKYVLKLNDEQKMSFKPTDTGTFMHEMLEKFMKYVAEKGNMSFTEDEISSLIDEIADKYCSSEFGTELLTPQLMAQTKRLKRSAKLMASDLVSEFSQSDFKPSFFELEIGRGDDAVSPLSVDIGDGKRLLINGFADRVDTWLSDGKLYVRVVDYKTGGKDFRLSDVRCGLSLQMLMYLYSICCDKDKKVLGFLGLGGDEELCPAGVLYCRAKEEKTDLDSAAEVGRIKEKASGSFKRRGVMIDDPAVLYAMCRGERSRYLPSDKTEKQKSENYISAERFNALLEEIKQTLKQICGNMYGGRADAEPVRDGIHNDCEYCELKPVCRKESYTERLERS